MCTKLNIKIFWRKSSVILKMKEIMYKKVFFHLYHKLDPFLSFVIVAGRSRMGEHKRAVDDAWLKTFSSS